MDLKSTLHYVSLDWIFMPVFFSNIFSGNRHINALIMGLIRFA